MEYFNGAFITLANERFPKEERYQKIGILTGTNAAMQCVSAAPDYKSLLDPAHLLCVPQVGSILIAPLIKRFPTRTVLSYAVLTFGLISMTLLICDAATGGKPKILNGGKQKYGTWNPNGLFPIYIISGVAYGMVELIRRVIPRNIVAGDVQRVSVPLGTTSIVPGADSTTPPLDSSEGWMPSFTSCMKSPVPPEPSPLPPSSPSLDTTTLPSSLPSSSPLPPLSGVSLATPKQPKGRKPRLRAWSRWSTRIKSRAPTT